jgi:16S rRNA (adenine1518-N6/adenine1519-N6)-dimethyltransferase
LVAKKQFGQHFLEDAWVAKVIAAIDPRSDDLFVEIGPGRGALTRPLARRAAHVIACELDRDLADGLDAAQIPSVTVLRGDFVAMRAETLRQAIGGVPVPFRRLRVVGNLPYNVGTVILKTLSSLRHEGLPIVDATVMLQREVADRLVAVPGTRDYSALTVLVGQWAVAERLLTVPPGAFRPQPSVYSALVRLAYRPTEDQPPCGAVQTSFTLPRDQKHFEALVKTVFGRRRKTLVNALRGVCQSGGEQADAILREAGIDGRRRPETLTLAELVQLADLTTPEPSQPSLTSAER